MREGTVRCQTCHSIVPDGDRCPACDEPLIGERRSSATLALAHDEGREVFSVDAQQHMVVQHVADEELSTGPDSLRETVRVELSYLCDCLQLQEQVLHLAVAHSEGHKGLLALTDRHLMFLYLRPAGYRIDTVRFERLTSVANSRNERGGRLTLMTFGSTQEFSEVRPAEGVETIAGYLRDRIARAHAMPISATMHESIH
jgi:hypothetical protein